MRETFDKIDHCAGGMPSLQGVLYDLAAHQLATQAMAIAAHGGLPLSDETAAKHILDAAGYPGITSRVMPDSLQTVGDRAAEILTRLIDRSQHP